ncbi:MAG: thioesterase family protein [Spirosomataceae bacterium]
MENVIQQLLANYPSVVELKVQWGDMDAAQHVNNTVYLRWFETARINYFNQIGFMDFRGGNGIGPILAESTCKYKLPVTYPDTVLVGARILPETINEFGYQMHHIVVSQRHQRIAAEGIARLVCYDYQALKKAPVPQALREKILSLENTNPAV